MWAATSARRSNVKLSAAAINGYVMNSGDVFSYNEAVGQRTAANGYQAAPAYVQGRQWTRSAAASARPPPRCTWPACGPTWRSRSGTPTATFPPTSPRAWTPRCPGAGRTTSSPTTPCTPSRSSPPTQNNYLTVQILGTNVDGTSVKMTNEWLSTTPYETVYEDDPTLAPGTEQVKTTPYTGYKYRTYRNVYDADGKLISSTYEATSDYKARNQVILRGPAVETGGGRPDPRHHGTHGSRRACGARGAPGPGGPGGARGTRCAHRAGRGLDHPGPGPGRRADAGGPGRRRRLRRSGGDGLGLLPGNLSGFAERGSRDSGCLFPPAAHTTSI